MGGTHYPDFDVLAEHGAWDEYTRSIVLRRLDPPAPATLTGQEVGTLRCILRHLLFEERGDILDFVVSHFDERLRSTVGEGQRKPGVPAEADLIRQGLLGMDLVARARHGQDFAACGPDGQFQALAALQNGQVAELEGFPQKELFQKLLGLAVDAYVSHPAVWSEIGYAGPAYPRGYYRLGRGVRDPWEPALARSRQGRVDAAGPADGVRRGTGGTADEGRGGT